MTRKGRLLEISYQIDLLRAQRNAYVKSMEQEINDLQQEQEELNSELNEEGNKPKVK